MSEFAATIDEVMWACHVNSINKGFWDYTDAQLENPAEVYLAKMMLITSEVTEIMEAFRKEQGSDAIEEEFADLLIRTFDLYAKMQRQGHVKNRLGDAVQAKMEKNKERPTKHGNLI